MPQNLITYEKALKEHYLPAWQNQLGIEPTPLLSKIKKVPLVGTKIVTSAPIGLSGGFGFGAEGAATPKAGHVMMEKFTTEARDMYVDIGISVKAVRTTKNGAAMADALDTEVKGAYDTAKWNVGRSFYGNGTGKLAKVTALAEAGNTITVDNVKMLKEGLIVDFYADGSEEPAIQGRRIIAVDRINKTIKIAGQPTTVPAGFVTVQNSYNRELTGLGAIYDDNIESIYGIDKAENPFLKPVTYDAGGDLTNSTITKVLREAKGDKNSQVDMLLCGDGAFDAYVDYLGTNNYRVEDKSHVLKGGFNAIKFLFSNREVDVVNESFVPEGEIWGVDTSKLEFHAQEWDFAQLQGGGIFNLMESQSVYRALLANYGDLICKNPGGCVRIYNCL